MPAKTLWHDSIEFVVKLRDSYEAARLLIQLPPSLVNVSLAHLLGLSLRLALLGDAAYQ